MAFELAGFELDIFAPPPARPPPPPPDLPIAFLIFVISTQKPLSQVRNELFEGRRPSCRSICDWKLPLFAAQLGWIHGVLIGNWVDIHTIYIYTHVLLIYLFFYLFIL